MADSKTRTITVTISGPQGSGKSSLAFQLMLFLRGRGVNCLTDEDNVKANNGANDGVLTKKGLVVKFRTTSEEP